MNRDIGALTGLRGIAALWVFFVHVAGAMQGGSPELSAVLAFLGKAGYLGVDIFFVLSGFVLTLNYAEAGVHRSLPQYAAFLWKRLARIYPVHIAALVLLVAVVVAFRAAGVLLSYGMPIEGLIFQLTLTHAWSQPIESTWNAVSWSISAEWAAYLAFPVIAFVAGKLRSPGTVLTLIVVAFVALWWTIQFGRHEGTVAYALQRIAAEFSSGVLVHRLSVLRGREVSRFGDALAAGCLALMIVGSNIVAMTIDWRLPLQYAPILACGIVYGLVIGRGWVSQALSSRAAIFAGHISYAFYMVHVLMLDTVKALLTSSEVAKVDHWIVAGILASLASTIVVATWLYYHVEEPARHGLTRLRGRFSSALARVAEPEPSR